MRCAVAIVAAVLMAVGCVARPGGDPDRIVPRSTVIDGTAYEGLAVKW